MRTLNPVRVVIPILCLAAVLWASPAHAQNVPFKVYITELWQLDAGVDPGIGLIGDYYAKVTINGVEHSNSGACDESTSTAGLLVPFRLFKYFDRISECGAKTPWVFTQQVPANQPVHVTIQLFDSDSVFDDEGDAKPGPGNAINLTIDPTTGQWSGDIAWPQDCSRPNLDLGGNNVNVCWQAGFDSDDDGLLDVWERFGVDTDNDGVIDINLPVLGANPLHKDVFVEADFLQAGSHRHSPTQTSISSVVTAFANAPVSNPDGTTGVQLHVDVGSLYGAGLVSLVAGTGGVTGSYGDLGGGNAIAEAGNETIEAFDGAKGSATKFADLKSANFDPLRETVFRYTIFGHQTNARRASRDCTSGIASLTRRDFLVTLGGLDPDGVACWGTDAAGFSVGFISEQSGTFMHELGHTLSLLHGGNADVNDKPNYLSVMNYTFQPCSVPFSAGLLAGGCDYSRLVSGALLPPLNETDLDECLGIGGGLGFGAVDWNGNGIFEGASMCGGIFSNTTADVNNDGVCVEAGGNSTLDSPPKGDDIVKDNGIHDGPNRRCSTPVATGTDDSLKTAVGSTPNQPNPLNSFDDWASVSPGLFGFTTGFGAGSSSNVQEPDPTTLRESRRYLADVAAPNVALDETGPATGKPGDLLSYSLTITNTGRGPALSAELKETSPDGTAQTTELGTLVVGADVRRNTAFRVPANACPGDFTGAGASMTFKDLAGHDLNAADTVPLQVLDVSAPTVGVSLSPAVLWPPNHQFEVVTATITVTDNCDHNPTVTLVSITSNEPEVGFLGQGDKGPDIQGAALGTDDRGFSLRSERGTGRGNTGRIYTVTYRVTDASGNATVKSAIVTVPTNNSGK